MRNAHVSSPPILMQRRRAAACKRFDVVNRDVPALARFRAAPARGLCPRGMFAAFGRSAVLFLGERRGIENGSTGAVSQHVADPAAAVEVSPVAVEVQV